MGAVFVFRDEQGVQEPAETSIQAHYYPLKERARALTGRVSPLAFDRMLRNYGLALSLVAAALMASLALQPLFPHPFLFLFF